MKKLRQILQNKKLVLVIDVIAVVNLILAVISGFRTEPFWNFYGMYVAIPIIILHQCMDAIMKRGLFSKKNWTE